MARGIEARRRLPAGAEDLGRDLPRRRHRDAGYRAIWHGQKGFNGVAILARGDELVERRRGLPGDPDDTHSRYIEADVAAASSSASIYLPNGNPQPGPKFDYKLAWFERLIAHAASLLASAAAGRAGGRLQRHRRPTASATSTRRRPGPNDALLQPESRAAYARLLDQGWTDAIRHLHPGEPIYTFWDYFRNRFARDAGLRIDHLLLNQPAAARLKSAGVDKAVRAREQAERPRADLGRARLTTARHATTG